MPWPTAYPTAKPKKDTSFLTGDPSFDAMFPAGWAKSARETKTNYLNTQVNQGIAAGGTEANRLTQEEESRGKAWEDLLRGAIQDANVPTLSQADIDRMFGQEAGVSGGKFLEGVGGLRSMLGESGLTGSSGWAAGLASNLESQRLASLITSRSDLLTKKATMDAQDRLHQFERMTQLGQAVNRPVAMENMDWLTNVLGVRLAQMGKQMDMNVAKDASQAGQRAGELGAIGQIGGALIGAFA